MKYFSVLCLLVFQAVAVADDADRLKASVTEQSVLETYKRMEQADRQGDAEAWFGLRDKKSLDAMNPAVKAAIRKGGRSRPAVKYEPLVVRTGNGSAVLMGKITDPAAGTTQFQSVLFVSEADGWKVSRELFSETAFDPFVLHGLLPPESGAFIRAGSPWKKVPYAAFNTAVLGKKEITWKMQAIYDESFVYIRFEWISDIPAPGSKISPETAAAGKTGGPPPPPAIQIKVNSAEPGGRSLTVAASDMMSSSGANKASVNYSMQVKNAAGDDIFAYSLGNDSNGRLLSVQGRYIDVRIPLSGLEVAETAKPKIELEEVSSVLRLMPYTAEHFAPAAAGRE
jgi:hypothetical protein